MQETRTLSFPALQETKQRFNKSIVARRHALVFDELLVHFRRDESLRAIAEAFHLTYRSACEIDARYIRPLLKNKGMERRRARESARRLKETQALGDSLAPNHKLRIAAAFARRNRHLYSFVAQDVRGTPRLSESLIDISGFRCAVYRIAQRKAPQMTVRRSINACVHAHFVLARTKSQDTDRLFIVPSEFLKPYFEAHPAKTEVSVAVPVTTDRPFGKHEVSEFENAWWVVTKTVE